MRFTVARPKFAPIDSGVWDVEPPNRKKWNFRAAYSPPPLLLTNTNWTDHHEIFSLRVMFNS